MCAGGRGLFTSNVSTLQFWDRKLETGQLKLRQKHLNIQQSQDCKRSTTISCILWENILIRTAYKILPAQNTLLRGRIGDELWLTDITEDLDNDLRSFIEWAIGEYDCVVKAITSWSVNIKSELPLKNPSNKKH